MFNLYKMILIAFLIQEIVYAKELQIQPRVIKGNIVLENDASWKFIVALKYNDQLYCAGNIISPEWVLTAAHCLFDQENNRAVLVSELDVVGAESYNIKNMINYSIEKFIIHPLFNMNTLDNDIALIKLGNPIYNIAPIRYDDPYTSTFNMQTKIAGWGNMSTTEYIFPEILREAAMPILDFNQCNASLSYNGTLTDNMICAGYWTSNRDSCLGDSGGPLVADNTLVGITSWGRGCAVSNYPGVYTKVRNYTQWINSYLPQKTNNLWTPIISDNSIVFIPY